MTTGAELGTEYRQLTETYAAHNYTPLDVVLTRGEGAWVEDVDGHRYLDCLSGYSALNFGHCHPRLVQTAQDQLHRLTLTSRAFYTDEFALFARDLAALCNKDMVLPMNTGAEAVETAVKVARRWGHRVKGLAPDAGTIIVMDGNFHGRTTTIVSFSTDDEARTGYGPYTPGFRVVPYGDAAALAQAIDDDTVAVLLEPVQGEAGVIIPPPGYLKEVRRLCTDREVLMLADEIQSGLARTGRTFASDHEDVVPDVYILGKALGGGILALSAIAADRSVMDVITPGSHGSTFGGNPLASAVGRAVLQMLGTGEFQEAARVRGAQLAQGLAGLGSAGVTAVRCIGLWAGLDLDPALMTGRDLAHRLQDRGVLAKDTHGQTLRIAPPRIVTEDEVDQLLTTLQDALGS